MLIKLIQSRWWFASLTAILAVAAAWTLVSAASPNSVTGGGIPAPRPGFFAPELTLPTITGETISLTDYRGRPVIINIWASWCAPCQAEMPAFQAVYDQYHAQGLEILAVNAASQDDRAAAETFVAKNGLTFPILLDTDGSIGQRYQLHALPTTFFVDANGVIQDVVVGGPLAEALLRIRVEQLLEER